MSEKLTNMLNKVANRNELQGFVAFCIKQDGSIEVISGAEGELKTEALSWWAKGQMKHAVTKIPFQTVFGWGNEGKPKPMTQVELVQVSQTADLSAIQKFL